MPPRIRRTQLQRVRLFERAHGICHICQQRIQVGALWELEHVVPLEDGGADDDSNIGPAHIACHRQKTAAEATARAKTRRIRAKHIGATGPGRSATPLPCGRRSGLKKTMFNGIVPRLSQAEMYRDLMRVKFGREV